YKNASAAFLRKQALRVSRGKTEYDTDDLTRETPRQRPLSKGESPWQPESLRSLCVEAAAIFRRSPGLLSAEASSELRRQWSRLIDSQGSRVDFGRDIAEIELEAVDISSDGLRQFANRRFAAATPQQLPQAAELKKQASEMLSELAALKVAAT